jgi:peptide/nickel transport system permease protein
MSSFGMRHASSLEGYSRLRRNHGAVAGTLVLLLTVALALAAPVSPFSPTRPAGARLSPPSVTFWFGTDTLGRDVLS